MQLDSEKISFSYFVPFGRKLWQLLLFKRLWLLQYFYVSNIFSLTLLSHIFITRRAGGASNKGKMANLGVALLLLQLIFIFLISTIVLIWNPQKKAKGQRKGKELLNLPFSSWNWEVPLEALHFSCVFDAFDLISKRECNNQTFLI